MSALRILFAHNNYGRPSGEEQAVDTTAQLLAEHGHEVAWLRKSSVPIMTSIPGQAHAFFAGIHSPRSRAEMASLLDRQQFDLLHVQNLYPFLSPSILGVARQRGLPIVMRCPNYRLFCPSGLHLSHGQLCERCLGGKEWWCVVKNARRCRCLLGSAGEGKGIELFLEAARALPNYPFAVAGDPRSYPGIERLAPSNVRFHGFLTGNELDNFWRQMRMLVAPCNWYEGFPNTIARAMAYGKPVVCSRIGALPEIVVDGATGLLHDPNSADELVAHIQRLYAAPELCCDLGEQGRQRALEEYSRERFYKQLMAIYESTMEGADREQAGRVKVVGVGVSK